jgi:dolichol kinase
MTPLLLGLGLRLLALYVVSFLLGLLVLRWKVRVNYTRKVFFLILALIATYLTLHLGPGPSPLVRVLAGIVFILFLATLSAPGRRRSCFLRVAFAAIDRPEDRPNTLLWLSSQTMATYLIVLGLSSLLLEMGREPLSYVIVAAASLGDGLAEPIGVRFGRHHYRTRALFTSRTYTRSLEGSLTVFLTSAVVIACSRQHFQGSEFLIVLLTLPLLLTLAEAVAPHTWDNPFLYTVGGGVVLLAIYLG